MADILGGQLGEKFKQENYASNLAVTLNTFRKKNYMCDIVLVCKQREFLAHRNVLSAASPYFRQCLSSDPDSYTSQGRPKPKCWLIG